jgi:hypothetical protein
MFLARITGSAPTIRNNVVVAKIEAEGGGEGHIGVCYGSDF